MQGDRRASVPVGLEQITHLRQVRGQLEQRHQVDAVEITCCGRIRHDDVRRKRDLITVNKRARLDSDVVSHLDAEDIRSLQPGEGMTDGIGVIARPLQIR